MIILGGSTLLSNEETCLALLLWVSKIPNYLPREMSWAVSFLFLTYPWIIAMVSLSRESQVTLTTPIYRGKRIIYNGKSVPCNRTGAPNASTNTAIPMRNGSVALMTIPAVNHVGKEAIGIIMSESSFSATLVFFQDA